MDDVLTLSATTGLRSTTQEKSPPEPVSKCLISCLGDRQESLPWHHPSAPVSPQLGVKPGLLPLEDRTDKAQQGATLCPTSAQQVPFNQASAAHSLLLIK